MAPNFSTSIVFISGTFLGNNCWDEWQSYFENKGYRCLALPWPHKEATPEELRNRQPDRAIASNRLLTITDHYTRIINALPEKPIVVGHSLGGLIVQLLVQRGLVSAGVAIHSFPPQGVGRFKFPFLKATWEAMGFFTNTQDSYMVSFRKWKQAITNGLNCDDQKELYYRYAIPESKIIVRDTFKCLTKIDFNFPHVPLLLTSGSKDRIVPAFVNYNNYKKYRQQDSITDHKEFKGHNHLVFGQPAWQEEADFVSYWLQGVKK